VPSHGKVISTHKHCSFVGKPAIDWVFFEAFGGMPVEYEKQWSSFID
jgi:hypothetical protein